MFLGIWRRHWWWIGLMGLILLVSAFWKKGRLEDNSRSRFITVERLVERNTWAHAAPGDTTPFRLSIDAIKVGDRIYSSKPPNYPLLMAGEAKVMKALTGMEFYPHRKDYLRMLLILNQILPFLIMLWLGMRMVQAWTSDPWVQQFMLWAIGAGTLAFGYSPEINNHSLAASLFFIAFYLVWKLNQGHRPIALSLLAGFLIGFGITIELTAGLIGLALLFLIFRQDWKLGLMASVMAVLPFLPELYIYHMISGSHKPFYLQGHLYRFEGSYWTRPQGADQLQEQQWLYFLKTLFGPKGLFVLGPLLLLAPISWWRHWRGKLAPMQWEWATLALGTLSVILYVGIRTHNYGGDCIGVRWYIVFMPLMMLSIWPLVESWKRSRSGKVLLIGLLLASALLSNAIPLVFDAFIDAGKLIWG